MAVNEERGERREERRKEGRTELRGTCPLLWTSILYPGGRKVLKPTMSSGWPLKRLETRLMTPGVSMLQ